ncbi:MAG: HPr family phosphocarrier protein [Pseudomonadales bacterium]|nr:HPr family phosphocarrier protein [Pseudomonadales bacterium]
MQSNAIIIINKLGLHARASAKFAALANDFEAAIEINKDGKNIDGKSIMQLMMLAANVGSEIIINTQGNDETEAMSALCELINNRFDEEE